MKRNDLKASYFSSYVNHSLSNSCRDGFLKVLNKASKGRQ